MDTLADHFGGDQRLRARQLGLVVLLVLLLVAPSSFADCLAGRLVGVNLAGAEFNSSRLPGTLYKDYAYPTSSDLRYFQSIGASVIRLPFRWERLQPTLFAELSATEVKSIQRVVEIANSLGVCVILDVHNYASYRGNVIGSQEVPVAAFLDLWSRIYAAFPSPAETAFGLMNEPAKISLSDWASIAQQSVDNLRNKGSRHLILVSGGRWSGAHDWFATTGGASNTEAFAGFRDKGNNYVIEVHQYADSNFSGTKTDCAEPQRMGAILGKVGEWAQMHGHKLFLGEFGVAATDSCLKVLDTMLSSVADGNVWRGWTYWAAGQWWGSYPFSVQPKEGMDAIQTKVLKQYLQN